MPKGVAIRTPANAEASSSFAWIRRIWGQIYFFFFSRFGFVDLTGRSVIVASIVRSMWRDFGDLRGIASTRLVRSPILRQEKGMGARKQRRCHATSCGALGNVDNSISDACPLGRNLDQ